MDQVHYILETEDFQCVQIKSEPNNIVNENEEIEMISKNEESDIEKYTQQLEENFQLTLEEKEILSKEVTSINIKVSQLSHELNIQKGSVRKLNLEKMKINIHFTNKIKELIDNHEKEVLKFKKIINNLKNENELIKFRLHQYEGDQSNIIPTPESDRCFVTSSIEKPTVINPEKLCLSEKAESHQISKTRTPKNSKTKKSKKTENLKNSTPNLKISHVESNVLQTEKTSNKVKNWVKDVQTIPENKGNKNKLPTLVSLSRTSISLIPNNETHLNTNSSSSLDENELSSVINDCDDSDEFYFADDMSYKDDEEDSDFELDDSQKRRKSSKKSANKKAKNSSNEKKIQKISKAELEVLFKNFPTINLEEAKKLLKLEKPEISFVKAKYHPFQDKEQKNMLKLVIGYGHYGHGYRKYFWTEHMSLFPNRVEGTVVQHWKNHIVEKPDFAKKLLSSIGFNEVLISAIINIMINISFDNDSVVSIVKNDEFIELTKFMLLMEEGLKNTS